MTPGLWALVALGVLLLGPSAACAAWKGLRGRARRVPGLPVDGRPLTRCERERLEWIEFIYKNMTAREPRRRR